MTVMAPDVDLDVEDITHLDFPPACDIRDCHDEGGWLIRWKSNPVTCCNPMRILCRTHLDWLTWHIRARSIVLCNHRRIVGWLPDAIERIEPL